MLDKENTNASIWIGVVEFKERALHGRGKLSSLIYGKTSGID